MSDATQNKWQRYYLNGILYQSGPEGTLSPISGPSICPKCQSHTFSFDARAGHMLCLLHGCGASEKVMIEQRDVIDIVKENLALKRLVESWQGRNDAEGVPYGTY